MKLYYKILKNEKGTSTIIMALIIVSLLIITAFVTDFGLAYVRTAQLQNGMDAAALAAATVLPIDDDDYANIQLTKQKAIEYATKNNISGLTFDDIQLDGDNNTLSEITVGNDMNVDLYIAPVIGINQLTVNRKATAQVSPTYKTKNIVPLSITQEYLDSLDDDDSKQHLELKLGSQSEDALHGAFGVVDFNGQSGGANDYKEWFANGYQGDVRVGQVIPVEAGVMTGPTIKAFNERYDGCTHNVTNGGCNIITFVEDCPRIVIVPVITYDDMHKNATIKSFSAFIIEDYLGHGKDNYVIGSFIRDVMTSGDGSITDSLGSGIDYGVYSISLIK